MSEQPELTIDEQGTKKWRLNGFLHREDGPAIEWTDGSRSWMQRGNYHRIGGPAIEYASGRIEWRINGGYHNPNGPAVFRGDLNGEKRWFLNDKEYSYEEWKAICKPFPMKCFHTSKPSSLGNPCIHILFSSKKTV